MANDERNFRSSYYEKVGFRSVEEKKSIEILLKDKPLDISKFKQFCLRFTVPGMYRNLMWKLLLGTISSHTDSHKFMMLQRQQEYEDLLHALGVMRIVTEQSSKEYLFLTMWLLQTGNLRLDWKLQIEDPLYQNMLLISQSLSNTFDNDVDAFWISRGFFQCVEKFHTAVETLTDTTKKILEKEDQLLYNHLKKIDALDVIPFRQWFCSCFAGVLKEPALAKIWDKLVGGSCKILVFVAIRVLTAMRRLILSLTSPSNVVKNLSNITEETAEMVANKAIELWQQYGSPLTPASGPDGIKSHHQHQPVARLKPSLASVT